MKKVRLLTLLVMLCVAGCSAVSPTGTPAPKPTLTRAVAPTTAPTTSPTTAPPTAPTTPPTAAPTIAPTGRPTTTPMTALTAAPPTSLIDSDLSQKLDREIERAFRQSDSPGLAVGVVRDQELVYAKGFGVMNLETGGEITPRTLFHMASVTKPFVATAIVQLLEQDKLSLDDRIVEYLPYFELKDDRYATLTIRHLLTHSSGMPDVDDYHWDEPEYDEGALERFVRGLADRELLFEPGAKFAYSNMAFEVLGDLIAKVSGQSFADYVKENILLPLGMNDSSILIRDVDPALLANGHVQEEGGKTRVTEHYAYNRRHGPSSTLHASVADMSRWAIANMNGGELEGRRILHPSSYELLWAPAVRAGVREGRPVHVGLSWFLSDYAGRQTVSHGGADIGYITNFVMVPEAGVAVIVLSNYFGPNTAVGEVTDLALELALGSE